MWTCKICQAEVDDETWEECWKCSTPRNLSDSEASDVRSKHEEKIKRFQKCLRCDSRIEYAGTRRFKEDRARGFFGELFANCDYFDVYYCNHCGKVEFFVDGVGDEMRGETQKGELLSD